MANTPNFSLYKPSRLDTTVEVDTTLAANFTTIDTELKARKDELDTHKAATNAHTSENISYTDGSVKSALDAINTNIAILSEEQDVQATSLSGKANDNDVMKKASFLRLGKNLYDKSKRQDGYRINSSGVPTTEGLAASYSTSGDIPVEAGKTLYISDNGVAWDFNRLVSYDASGNIVSFTTAAVTTYTVPTNVVKIKFSGSITRMNGTVQVEYAQINPFEEYGEFIDRRFIKELKSDALYVSPTGNDANTGLSDSQALATVNKAILSGAKTVYVKRGTYTGMKIEATGISELNILPYGDGDFITLRVDSGDYANPVNLNSIPKLKLVGIKVENPSIKGFKIWGCNGDLINCESYSSSSDAFSLDGSNLKLSNCYAINSVRDGFNAHEMVSGSGTIAGYVEYYDCKAIGNGDDGLSHHEKCKASVYGGEFKNNVQGGITPYGQAVINVQNAVIEGNGLGLYGFQSGTILANPTVYSRNNLFKNNGTGIIVQYYNIVSIGDKFAGNTTNTSQTSGTITTY